MVDLFLLWKRGATMVDLRKEPNEVAVIIKAMDNEFLGALPQR